MVQLITLEQIKQALIVDHHDDDDALELALEAASGRIVLYLKDAAAAFITPDGVDLDAVPATVKASVILLVRRLYKPEGDQADDLQTGELPRQVTMMLLPLRRPTLA